MSGRLFFLDLPPAATSPYLFALSLVSSLSLYTLLLAPFISYTAPPFSPNLLFSLPEV